ncbi:MAG: outer membrane beta-barrel protein [Chthoniobacterales bacterium]|nr:outer membrane beta-barrel protein [Chthoniobacterales bacterium]
MARQLAGQEAVSSAMEEAGLGWFPAVPIQITAGGDIGYDDNAALASVGQGSVFTRENVVLTYARPGGRTQLSLIGVGRFSQFFDLNTDDKNGNVTLSLTHDFSSRLFFYANVYAAYATEPDFKSDVGPENLRADHFDTNDIFALTYSWLPRLNTVTSFTLRRVKYSNSSVGAQQDRLENTIAQEISYSLTRRTKLVADYRYEWIDYDTAPTDSTTHYVLAGFDHRLTEHLAIHLRGGESFRSLENNGHSDGPYFEGSLDYSSSNHWLSWTTSYGFEAPNAADIAIRKTLRTGFVLTYLLTSRISSTAAVYYHHDENEGPPATGSSSVGAQDTVDFQLGLSYTINKRLSLHVNYNHTSQSALQSAPGYSRNSYSAGLTYTY